MRRGQARHQWLPYLRRTLESVNWGVFFLFWMLSAAHLSRLPWYGLKKEERGAMYPVQRTGFCTGNSFDGAFVC